MKLRDLLRLAFDNLRRRKSRTILTSIGVMIGCASILVMVSIGAGLGESMTTSLEGIGGLTTIEVYGMGGQMMTSNVSGSTDNQMTDETLAMFQAIDHVALAGGIMTLDNYPGSLSVNDRFVTDWASVAGIDPALLEALGLEMAEGVMDLTPKSTTTIPVLFGETFAYNFRDTMRPEGMDYIDRYANMYDENGMYIVPEDGDESAHFPDPFFNPLEKEIRLDITTDFENDKKLSAALKPVGRMKANYQITYETDGGIIMDIEQLKSLLKKADKEAGKQAQTSPYNRILVVADDVSTVGAIEKEIRNMGYSTSSMQSVRESMEEQSRMAQMILGGLGAISLIVAAIGITNTMVMSITERTREIGIMKAIGCRTRDIRLLFLCESGMIGLLGGIFGLMISYLISTGLNYFAWGSSGQTVEFIEFLFTPGTRLSVISPVLAGFGLLFSIGIGVLSGYMPARKAVRISALEAIRHD